MESKEEFLRRIEVEKKLEEQRRALDKKEKSYKTYKVRTPVGCWLLAMGMAIAVLYGIYRAIAG